MQIVLGTLFWTGHAAALVPAHMRVGTVFVFALWLSALLAARAGRGWGAVLALIVAGLFVAWLGMAQRSLLPGSFHWAVRVGHLLAGVAALALAERLSPR